MRVPRFAKSLLFQKLLLPAMCFAPEHCAFWLSFLQVLKHCKIPSKQREKPSIRRKIYLSWQGVRGEPFCLAAPFLSNCIFGRDLDGPLKQAMKSGVRPEGIMAQSPFKEAMEGIADACAKVLKNDESTPGASVTALVPGDDNQVLSQFLDSDQLKSLAGEEDKAEQLRTWAKAALCQVDRFVKLVVEPPTHQLLAEVLKTTVLCEDDQRSCLIFYDCKTAGESSSQPHIRFPSFKQERLRKLCQGYIAARGLEDS